MVQAQKFAAAASRCCLDCIFTCNGAGVAARNAATAAPLVQPGTHAAHFHTATTAAVTVAAAFRHFLPSPILPPHPSVALCGPCPCARVAGMPYGNRFTRWPCLFDQLSHLTPLPPSVCLTVPCTHSANPTDNATQQQRSNVHACTRARQTCLLVWSFGHGCAAHHSSTVAYLCSSVLFLSLHQSHPLSPCSFSPPHLPLASLCAMGPPTAVGGWRFRRAAMLDRVGSWVRCGGAVAAAPPVAEGRADPLVAAARRCGARWTVRMPAARAVRRSRGLSESEKTGVPGALRTSGIRVFPIAR